MEEASFTKKSIQEVGVWLEEENFNARLVNVFQENDIDREAFMMLEEKNFVQLVPSIGARKKLLKKKENISENESSNHNGAGLREDDGNDDDDYHMSVEASSIGVEEEQQEEKSSNSNVAGVITIKSRIITKREPEPPLKLPFELPRNYTAAIKAGLESGFLSSKVKPKFIASVAAAVFQQKSYPTKEEYQSIGQQIVLKHPFLKSCSGTGYGYLVEAIRDKMKYLRNSGKPKRAASDVPTTEPGSKKIKTEFKQYPQVSQVYVTPPGEDSMSNCRNQKLLVSEEKKTKLYQY